MAFVATCAAALLGAVVFTASQEPAVEPLPTSAHLPVRPLDQTPLSSPMAPALVRVAAHELPAEAAAAAPSGAPEVMSLGGWVVGHAPGHGEAWAIEAYRLTPDRTAVLECRRAYVEPNGQLRLTGLEAGLWQTALVSPRFAWGPLVDTAAPPAALRLGADVTGRVRIDTVADGAAPRGVPLCLSLTAVRSPALAESLVSVQRRLPAHELFLGEALTLEGVSEGTYDVSATIARDEPGWGLRPRTQLARITVGPGTAQVELAFFDPSFAAQVPTVGKAAAPH